MTFLHNLKARVSRGWLAAGALLGSGVASLAEGETAQEVTMHSAVQSLQTAATDTINEVKPALVAIIVALFVIVGIVFAWNKLKGRFGR